jgi:hypothetical protein
MSPLLAQSGHERLKVPLAADSKSLGLGHHVAIQCSAIGVALF